MYGYPQMMGYYGGGLNWIFMILWWALIVFGIVALVRWLRGYGGCCLNHGQEKPARPAGGSALDILKERYAKGEINHQDFEKIKKELE